MLNEWNANINYKDKMLELEDEEEIISIPVWYIRQVEESEESEYESESEESEYEQESKRKLYTMKEIVREEELKKKNESSSEESSSDYSDSESESESEKDV